jgi:alkanesulfonate monooxygenase SsuD/methylene tetrahydromethanopterin reductase-like flavin-dependent oxidoreductase (luciferase family)
LPALQLYRARFEPSAALDRPYAMPTVNVFAADSDAAARRQFTSQQQSFTNLRRGTPGTVPPPIDDIDAYWSPAEKAGIEHAMTYSFVGSSATVERGLRAFLAATEPDELMLTAHTYDAPARLRSIELVAEVRDKLGRA